MATTSPPKKPNLRSRMSGAIRRNSAFTLPKRPSTPRIGPDTDPLSSNPASKAASIASSRESTPAPTSRKRPSQEPSTDNSASGSVDESRPESDVAKDPEQQQDGPAAASASPEIFSEPESEPVVTVDPSITAIPSLTVPVQETQKEYVEPAITAIPSLPESTPEKKWEEDGPSYTSAFVDSPEPKPLKAENIVEEPLPQSESPQSLSRALSRDDPDLKPLSPIQESPSTDGNDSANNWNMRRDAGVDPTPAVAAPEPPVLIAVNPAAVNQPSLVMPMPAPRNPDEPPSDDGGDGVTPRPNDSSGLYFPAPPEQPTYTYMRAMPVTAEQQERAPQGYVVAVPVVQMPVAEPSKDFKESKSAPIPIPQTRAAMQSPLKDEVSGFPFYVDTEENPFRDPATPIAPPERHSPVDMPEPESYMPYAMNPPPPPEEPSYVESTPAPVVMPLPPLREITSVHAVRHIPSDYTLTGRSSAVPSINEHPTDERQPLLSRSAGKQVESVNVMNPEGNAHILWPTAQPNQPTLHSHGWTEHALPDTTTYYTHDEMRITTDVDIRSARKLQAINTYLNQKRPEQTNIPPEHWELWLRDAAATTRDDFVPARCWINHEDRTVSFNPPPGSQERSLPSNDDKMELECRYWSFMESHPAHAPLPFSAASEAMDVLTWSYTDSLLSKKQAHSRPPFDQDECQQLMGLLRSLDTVNSDIQRIILTRAVSRILLRVGQWRQRRLRHEKSHLLHLQGGGRRDHRTAHRRDALHYVLACLCLGIPFFFADRHGHVRYDEEGGSRLASSLLVIGASVCLVAAIVLSAAVTFLALPGLDNTARTAGLICIIGTIASLASSVVAAFRHQTEINEMRAVGDDLSLLMTPRGSILISLPAVFLAWSILAFITGILLYAFRGFVQADPVGWTEKIEAYTRWTAVGVLGFSAGVLIIALMVVRRY